MCAHEVYSKARSSVCRILEHHPLEQALWDELHGRTQVSVGAWNFRCVWLICTYHAFRIPTHILRYKVLCTQVEWLNSVNSVKQTSQNDYVSRVRISIHWHSDAFGLIDALCFLFKRFSQQSSSNWLVSHLEPTWKHCLLSNFQKF